MKKTKEYDITKDINELINLNEYRIGKYARNYRYYNNSPLTTDRTIRQGAALGFYQGIGNTQERDTTRAPNINVIKQAVNTLYNKLAEVKVRPFFNTVNGSFEDIQSAKTAQQYFDLFYDKLNVYRLVSDAFKDSLIFDTGNLYINETTERVERILPGFVYTRPAERYYNNITRAYILKKEFPVVLMEPYKLDKYINPNAEYIDFGIYYDIKKHLKAYVINGKVVEEQIYDKEVIPLVYLYYETPVSTNTISVVDILLDIQRSINKLMEKINDSSQKTSPNTVIIPEGSNVQADSLSNRVAQIVTYRPAPGVTNPIQTITNDFISPQYMDTVKELIEQAFAQVGLSQLSTQAKKPTGLDSGIALDSYENIESDRHEALLSQIVRAYVDIARICIEVFDGDVLPVKENRSGISWSDVKKASDNMSIQFSAAESLSKDPSEKLKQLQALAQAGIIPQSKIAQLMELPDLETGFSFSTNVIEAAQKLIIDVLENGKVELPKGDFLNYNVVKEQILNCQNNLYANDKNNKNGKQIELLNKLYDVVVKREKEIKEPKQPEQQAPQEQSQETGLLSKQQDESGDWNINDAATEQ